MFATLLEFIGVCQVYFTQGTAGINGVVTFIDYAQDFILKGITISFPCNKR